MTEETAESKLARLRACLADIEREVIEAKKVLRGEKEVKNHD